MEPGFISIMDSMLNSIRYVHVDEPQGNIRSLNPYYFTNIFASEIFTQTHFAIITNVNARQRIVEMHKSTTQRDILYQG
jgi:hypothetical protein